MDKLQVNINIQISSNTNIDEEEAREAVSGEKSMNIKSHKQWITPSHPSSINMVKKTMGTVIVI